MAKEIKWERLTPTEAQTLAELNAAGIEVYAAPIEIEKKAKDRQAQFESLEITQADCKTWRIGSEKIIVHLTPAPKHMADGILTGAGKEKWHTSTINKILRNEKYMGDALLQKTYTTDFLTKKRIKNNGIVPQYYVEDDHEAIIPKELFMQVQAELVRRRVIHTSPSGKKRTFSCNHCFAQMVFCGDCGELYRRVHWNNHGCKSIVWRCMSRLEPSSAEMNCDNRTVNETLLQEVTVKAINQILTERKVFQKQLQANIAKAVVSADTLSPDGIQARLEELQKELIKKANHKQDYDAIADEIFRLREQKEQSEVDSHRREETMNRIKELQDFITKQKTDITEFDEALVKKLIEKITVFADHFTVEFKSGLTIEIEA